jgi:hypothetical protein
MGSYTRLFIMDESLIGSPALTHRKCGTRRFNQ